MRESKQQAVDIELSSCTKTQTYAAEISRRKKR